MNLTQLTELVKASGADAWQITQVLREGMEFYFIRQALDQNRFVETNHTTVRLFKELDGGQAIGSASEEIPPTASKEEAQELLASLLGRASYASNPYYTLNAPAEPVSASGQKAPDVAQVAKTFLETMRSIPASDEACLNSYEIFANVKTVRLLNSRGVDLTAVYPDSMLEVVVNANRGEKEIELYRISRMGSCDAAELKRSLAETMRIGQDRLRAQPMPKLGNIPVLFTSADVKELAGFFISRMSASFKKRGYSDWEIGKPLFDGKMQTPLSLETKLFLPNSSCNRFFDEEGALRRDAVLIRAGVPECFLGDRQFSCYLGLENSFQPGNYTLSGGTESEEALRTGDYLEAVEFSDFQTDALSGSLGGEIRLAYWHHDGITTPVTGGSISASMLENAASMRMSKELRQYDNMEVPAAIRLENVSVTGIE